MRHQRHTTAYVASWQASGNRTAPHRLSSEKTRPTEKAPTFQPGLSSRHETPTLARGLEGSPLTVRLRRTA
jgi:hypothetical protein